LVSGHRGVEDEFAGRDAVGGDEARGFSLEDLPAVEDQMRDDAAHL